MPRERKATTRRDHAGGSRRAGFSRLQKELGNRKAARWPRKPRKHNRVGEIPGLLIKYPGPPAEVHEDERLRSAVPHVLQKRLLAPVQRDVVDIARLLRVGSLTKADDRCIVAGR
eukprot:scaffold2069_cov254-Pinguiococcus_pyrenoidosus.AAC.2